jgi:hypothetical protein
LLISSHKYPTSHDCTAAPKQQQPSKVEKKEEGPSFWDMVSDRLNDVMKTFSDSDNPKARQAALLNMKQKAQVCDFSFVSVLRLIVRAPVVFHKKDDIIWKSSFRWTAKSSRS